MYRIDGSGMVNEQWHQELNSGVSCLTECHSEPLLVSGHTDSSMKLWNHSLATPHLQESWKLHAMRIECIDSSPHRPLEFLSCSADGTFCRWRADDVKHAFSHMHPLAIPVVQVAYANQNSKLFAVCPLNNVVELWDSSTMLIRHRLEGRQSSSFFSCMAFNAYDENLLAIASEAGDVSVWDLRKLSEPRMNFTAHGLSVSRIRFNPHDPGLVATSSTDSTVKIWSVTEEEERMIASYRNHTLPVTTMDWSVHSIVCRIFVFSSASLFVRFAHVESQMHAPQGRMMDSGSDYSMVIWDILPRGDK
ncbi:Type II secretion system (T2SS)-associated protein Gcp2 [Andalucia godoyi]|uniref:Peroxin-7 n=1 Tax=Andalucia godoyi TaxID=505711 RepID=A0A8K0F480_ANDGO|nr:Type II secretion system (T2SS)-associated protein Gcp2 [Andalucia godoyi]|eukprot:ANDGO_03640.mRNA.1 Type II secretion system (T2SS)-associated protein Gcp2